MKRVLIALTAITAFSMVSVGMKGAYSDASSEASNKSLSVETINIKDQEDQKYLESLENSGRSALVRAGIYDMWHGAEDILDERIHIVVGEEAEHWEEMKSTPEVAAIVDGINGSAAEGASANAANISEATASGILVSDPMASVVSVASLGEPDTEEEISPLSLSAGATDVILGKTNTEKTSEADKESENSKTEDSDNKDDSAASAEEEAVREKEERIAAAVAEGAYGDDLNLEDLDLDDEYEDFAIAKVDYYVNVRSGPDTDSEVLGKMPNGSVASIIERAGENGEWFKVKSGDVEGYIKSSYFIYGDAARAVMEDYTTYYAKVTADLLYVRKEPNTECERVGYLSNGETVPVVERGEGWTKVSYAEGKEGYISNDYFTLKEEFLYAKSIEEERAEEAAKREQEARARKNNDETIVEVTTSSVAAPTASYNTNSELRQAIVNYAMQYNGYPYVSGGRSLQTGTDCSGFTCYVYAAFGYGISRVPVGQLDGAGRSVSLADAKPGDIICFSTGGSRCTHVGLYLGNGTMIHAANPRKGVLVSNIKHYGTVVGIKNLVD